MKFRLTFILVVLLLVGFSLRAEAQSWEWLNGPNGGDVTTLATNSSGHVFAGTGGGGVLRSTDSGANWEILNVGNTSGNSVPALAINQSSGYIYAGTFFDGVYRSTDNGNNWALFNSGLPYAAIWSLVINSSGHIFAATSGSGVYRSTDNGANWVAINYGLTGLYSLYVNDLVINSSGQIFASTGAGVFRSDSDSSWIHLNNSPNSVALAINLSGQIFAGSYFSVYRSTDNGDSWTMLKVFDSRVHALAINSSSHIFVGTFERGVYRSTDNGSSYDQINNGLAITCIRSFAMDSIGYIFTGTSGGVFRSIDNGGSWTPVNNGFRAIRTNGLAVNSSGYIFAGTEGGGVFRSTDNGVSWTWLTQGISPFVNTLVINSSGIIFAGTETGNNVCCPLPSWGGVYASPNNGNNWVALNGGLTQREVRALAFNLSGHIFAGTLWGGVFRSTDNGVSWVAINDSLTDLGVLSLAINLSGHIFAGTRDSGVFRSTDNGFIWTQQNSGLTNHSIATLAINSSGHIFAGTQGDGVFRSTDNGASWIPRNIGLGSNNIVHSLVFNSKGHIFATGSFSVYRSYNNGDNWTAFNAGLPANRLPWSLAIGPNDVVYVGDGWYGVYRYVPDFVSGVDMAVSLWGTRARPGFQKTYSILYENRGSQNAKNVNLSLKLTLPVGVEYASCDPSPCGINGQTVSWSLGGVGAFTGGPASVVLNVLPWALAGDIVSGSATVSTTSSDVNLVNNRSDDVEQVVNSWDPNDKEVQPLGGGVAKYIMPEQALRYTIFFENDSSATAEAINIQVLDTLDANLDWSTLEIGAMSHPDTCQAVFDNVSGVLTWLCDSIMLPPNHTPPEGEGFVTFSILPDSGLPFGTQIKNQAHIKFDYNPWIAAPESGPVIRTIGKMGDANADGQVSVSDVVYLVSYLFKGGSAPVPLEAGDVNCDGNVTVGDVVYLINYLFKGGPPPC